ncbi:MAG TPA: class I SAM-dependent methyltransferase [Bacteroidia bacterium]|nr:class I SAM-dependent methyltransferase [Bacteroidia bacterium]
MKPEPSAVDRAHAIYTRRNLALYDWWVLRVSNRWFWHCETEKQLGHYLAHITPNHLEVGVGTGYYPAHSIPSAKPRIALLDINGNCLERAAARLAPFKPEVYQRNVLEPFELPGPQFDSVGMNYLLQCLPGRLEDKAGAVLDHVIPFLDNDGVVFGATVLGRDVQRPLIARMLMAVYNWRGFFSNAEDSLGGIMEALSERFRVFNVEVRGCVVLFWGRGLKEKYRKG